MEVTKIYNNDGTLTFEGEGKSLATLQDYCLADRCEGSIFEALQEGEVIELADGLFVCDSELDLSPIPPERIKLFFLKKRVKTQSWVWGNINRLKRKFFYKPSGYISPDWDSDDDWQTAIEQYKALKKKKEANG